MQIREFPSGAKSAAHRVICGCKLLDVEKKAELWLQNVGCQLAHVLLVQCGRVAISSRSFSCK